MDNWLQIGLSSKIQVTQFKLDYVCVLQGIEHRASYMLSTHFTAELQLHPEIWILYHTKTYWNFGKI
jgi:hypothetical protein